MAVLVLAGNLWEANAYGREKGFRVRFATGPEIVQVANRIVELPSFRQRRDRFAMQAALTARLRYGKGVEYEFASDWTWTRPTPADRAPKPERKSDREVLVDAFDAATEALAANMQMTSEELIRHTVSLLDKVQEVEGQEPLPELEEKHEPTIVVTPTAEEPPKTHTDLVERLTPEPEPFVDVPNPVKKATPARKRTAKKAAPKPPVVDAPVEF